MEVSELRNVNLSMFQKASIFNLYKQINDNILIQVCF